MIKHYLNEYIRVRFVPTGDYITTEDVVIRKVYYIITDPYYELCSSEQGKTNLLSRKRAPQFLGVDRAVNHYFSKLEEGKLYQCEDFWCGKHAIGVTVTPKETHEAFFLAGLACEKLESGKLRQS